MGFLTGGRKKSFFLRLSEDEQMVQLEEAYARATVAITRARSPCLIMDPLDMKGLVGAATVMGTTRKCMVQGMSGLAKPIFTFMMVNFPGHRSDETFIQMLQQNCCLSVRTSLPRPLWRRCKIMSRTTTRYVAYTSLWLTCGGLGSTILLVLERSLINFGVFLMGNDTHRVWCGLKRDGQSYTLLDTSTTDTLPLNNDFFRPLGMEHFYDSFALGSQISVRREALHLFGLRADELLPDLHITRDGVLRIELGAHQKHRVNHVARAMDRTKVSAMLYNWQPIKWIRRLNRLCMPVTLKEVKVRVTWIRMTPLLH